MRILSRIAAVLAVVVLGLTLGGSPARANLEVCPQVSTNAEGFRIWVCAEDTWVTQSDGSVLLHVYSGAKFEVSSTSANRCKITAYAALRRPGYADWKTATTTNVCTYALQPENRGWSYSYPHTITGTAATSLNVYVCMDLYYGTSTTSGWQRCVNSGWHNRSA
ncbi:hypothetical protein FB565_008245 [Actinoplanes lutulentus]|uniref:Uncharacterized protein n=1 Tax=Actinoplanes lutulentus TaxID=1287878 RepID=A0A327Z7V1_9ACTN|nr:hypothetical protein [Actinoplanes lutulentus]MBB2948462.1 hypothetical protein [Actinoplanes lutulentus]RAK34505.1 hypothetical protein B0I29_111104 [Actinoplanes lutulentus]